MRIQWVTQNEASDDDGALLEGEACFRAEMEWLRLHGCPETNKARFISHEVIDRDESLMTAYVTAHMARWLFTYTEAEDVAPTPGTPEHAEWLKAYNEELLRKNPQWDGVLPTTVQRRKNKP